MSYINEFPHGRMWDSDLRQILEMYNTVKGLPDSWETFSNQMHNDWNNLKQFVNTYFTNLDVQNEINRKIDALVADGTIDAMLKAEFRVYTTEINARMHTLETRMNTFTALPNESTTGDAELLDARIDYKGNEWANVGEHIRGVTGNIHPSNMYGITPTGNLIPYWCEKTLPLQFVYTTGDDKLNIVPHHSLNTYVVGVELGESYWFSTTKWWALTDENDNLIRGCGVNGTLLDRITIDDERVRKLYVSTDIATPMVAKKRTPNPNAKIAWYDPLTSGSVGGLQLDGNAVTMSHISAAKPLGNLIPYFSDMILKGTYCYGRPDYKVIMSKNDAYTCYRFPIDPTKVYYFSKVWSVAVTTKDDVVLSNIPDTTAGAIDSLDMREFPNAYYLYFSTANTNPYVSVDGVNIASNGYTLEGLSMGEDVEPIALTSLAYPIGKPLPLQFSSVMQNDDCYHTLYPPSKNIKMYDSHLDLTGDTAGLVSYTLGNYDKLGKSVGSGTFNINYKELAPKNMRGIVIGDSTVNSENITLRMLNTFTANGVTLELLGTRGTAPNLHEGRGGWTAKAYCTAEELAGYSNPFYNNGFDFSYYMQQQGYSNIDFVVIQLGINDLFTASISGIDAAYSTFISYINQMVESIRAYDDGIKVIINTIIPCNSNQDTIADIYGTNYPAWQTRYKYIRANAKLSTGVAGAIVCPIHYVIDGAVDIRDDVHPVYEGYGKIGEFLTHFLFANV